MRRPGSALISAAEPDHRNEKEPRPMANDKYLPSNFQINVDPAINEREGKQAGAESNEARGFRTN
jgi:hypothetical protein